MALTSSLLLSLSVIIFSAGSAYGIVKVSLRNLTKDMDEMKKNFKQLSNCDELIRNYLFGADHMPVYVPASICKESHTSTNRRLDQIDKKLDDKMDKITEAIKEAIREART